MKRHAAALVALILTACATPEMLKKQSTLEVCSAYHRMKTIDARNELVRRGAFSDAEWALIDANKIKIGMSEEAFICSWGTPSGWGDVNRRTSAQGMTKQYVYRLCRACSTNYVYVRDGKVSSWSD